MSAPQGVPAYRPATLTDLAGWLADAAEGERWRLVVEFLKEYRHELTADRWRLLADEPRRSVMNTGMCCSQHCRNIWQPGMAGGPAVGRGPAASSVLVPL
jgi:hypothetical protein